MQVLKNSDEARQLNRQCIALVDLPKVDRWELRKLCCKLSIKGHPSSSTGARVVQGAASPALPAEDSDSAA